MFAGANHPKCMTTGHLHAGQPALHDQFSPPREVHMSTHADPSKDEYLELEKKLGEPSMSWPQVSPRPTSSLTRP